MNVHIEIECNESESNLNGKPEKCPLPYRTVEIAGAIHYSLVRHRVQHNTDQCTEQRAVENYLGD